MSHNPNIQPQSESNNRNTNTLKSWISHHRYTLVVVAATYLLLVIFFAPIVFRGMGLTPAADMIAAAGMYTMGEEAIASGQFPLWNPTLFCGIPMFASLQYALFTYPPEYLIRLFSHIFGMGDYRIWVFHYFLAGLFMYLLARHYGCGRMSAWISGIAFSFSPQLIVLADVGHGSKLMGITYLPLIWLLTDRLRLKPSLGRAVALGVIFAIEVLALHPQIAAYGALVMGMFLLYHLIDSVLRKTLAEWAKFLSMWAVSMVIALGLSAILWVSVLDYAKHSIRGAGESGVAGGGVTWDYATGWSFHPLESITFLFPNFMGFAGSTYWGTVGTPSGQPFTQNPMYFGVVVLLLAILAMFLTPKKKWGLPLTIGLIAWVLSFGKYLPLLYGPFFHLLPYFNKFRAPVMGQVLLLLPMALLAGIGLEALVGRIRSAKENVLDTKKIKSTDKKSSLEKSLVWITIVSAGVALISAVSEGLFTSVYASIVRMLMPETHPQLIAAAMDIARPDVARVGLYIAALTGLSLLGLRRKIPWPLITGIFILVLIIDLYPINSKLVNFTPKSQQEALYQPEGLVKQLSLDTEKFRIHPVMMGIRPRDPRYANANWWSIFGLESTVGYFGAKMADYQRFMSTFDLEGFGALYRNPELLDILNVRYIITTVPLDQLFVELERQGWGKSKRDASVYGAPITTTRGGGYLYRNPGQLNRARLVEEYEVIPEVDATFAKLQTGDFDSRRGVILDREPEVKPSVEGIGKVIINDYRNEYIKVSVTVSDPKILVLSDSYYTSGWTATLNGKPVDIMKAYGILRAVAVPAGDHVLEFRFHPTWFYIGMWVSIISLVVAVGVGIWGWKRGRG